MNLKLVATDRQACARDRVVRVAARYREHVRVAGNRAVRVQTNVEVEREHAVVERIKEHLDRHVVRRAVLINREADRYRCIAGRRAGVAAERIERINRDHRTYIVIYDDVLRVLPVTARLDRRLLVGVHPVAGRVGQTVAGRRLAERRREVVRRVQIAVVPRYAVVLSDLVGGIADHATAYDHVDTVGREARVGHFLTCCVRVGIARYAVAVFVAAYHHRR